MNLILKYCLSLTEFSFNSFCIFSCGLTTMFIFGSIESILKDLLFFNDKYRALIFNIYDINIRDILNFSGLMGFLTGSIINYQLYKYILFKYNLKIE